MNTKKFTKDFIAIVAEVWIEGGISGNADWDYATKK
jgi:hypothetical protein